ncbi:hypothetical protein HOY82DRAFT_600345 [Tuber indicum]|nr:hypothetical protein HOY82DRAFT_600345 [Tuber indicum]
MPPGTNTPSEPPPRGAIQSFQQAIMRDPDSLRELLEQWTFVLADPETPEVELETINRRVQLIAWGITDALVTIRRRLRALEAEGSGRGGAERARGAREWSFAAHPDVPETEVHTLAPVALSPVKNLTVLDLIHSRRSRHSIGTIRSYTLLNGMTVQFLAVRIRSTSSLSNNRTSNSSKKTTVHSPHRKISQTIKTPKQMPPQTNTSPQPPPGACHSFLLFIPANPDILRDLLELWVVVLGDPDTPDVELERIKANIDIIAWRLINELRTARRMRVLEAGGSGRGGAEQAR